MILTSFLSGISAILYPQTLSLLVFYFYLFIKLSKTKKENWQNLILFSIIFILSFFLIINNILTNKLENITNDLLHFNNGINVLTIFFCIWITGVFSNTINEKRRNMIIFFFKYIGLITLGCKLALLSISPAGPIIGAFFKTSSKTISLLPLLFFSIGILIPFYISIGGIGTLVYNRIREKKWTNLKISLLGIFLIISAFQSLKVIDLLHHLITNF